MTERRTPSARAAAEHRAFLALVPQRRMTREVAVAAILLSVFSLFIARSVWVQILRPEIALRYDGWDRQSVEQRTGRRGPISDRNGEPLAVTQDIARLIFDPRHYFVQSGAPNVDQLVPVLERFELYRPERLAGYRDAAAAGEAVGAYWALTEWTDPARIDAIRRELDELGVRRSFRVERSSRRWYPHGELAGHTIGGATIAEGGFSGVEVEFDSYLRGRQLARPVFGPGTEMALTAQDLASADGNQLVLTLDARLQRFVESRLAATVEHYEARRGYVVVSRPETGELLALASWPYLDPNEPPDGWTGSPDPVGAHVLHPGSTAKIMTWAMALDAGVVGEHETITNEGGRIVVAGHQVVDTEREPTTNLREAFMRSSNVVAVRLAQRVGAEGMFTRLRGFGVGRVPGAGLHGESTGRLTRPRWPESQLMNAGYGYGFSMSPLQVNQMTAAIANGGVRMQPHILGAVYDAEGRLVERAVPREAGRATTPRTAEILTRFMRATVETGTGRAADIEGAPVAGKTGTIRERRGAGFWYAASFSGFVPVDDPAYAITVIIVEPNKSIGYYGGAVAAPLFREIAATALLLDGRLVAGDAVAPPAPSTQDEPVVSVTTPEAVADGGVPSFEGLRPRQAAELAAEAGLRVRYNGEGRVFRQSPAAGAALQGDTVELWLTTGRVAGGVDAP